MSAAARAWGPIEDGEEKRGADGIAVQGAGRTRLRFLNLMVAGEVCVCFFVETPGASWPKISRHLAYLRRAGVVAARREGKWMHYRIAMPEDERADGSVSELSVLTHAYAGRDARAPGEHAVALDCTSL